MSTLSSEVAAVFDAERIREDFPVLQQTIHGKPLVYLDSAATAQKPQAVIDAIRKFYEVDCANIHRGVHELSQRSTAAYEAARGKAKRFINARGESEMIFVHGTTEGINLVAASWGRKNVKPGDEIVISAMEHHSNIVPWQMLCEEKGARLRVIPMNDRGELLLEEYEKLLGPRTRMVAFAHVSNALGTINPVRQMIEMAHRAGALALIDGAQAVPHMKVDVQALDADFYAFSGHKMCGPTGIGFLYGKNKLLGAMPPYQGGGDMIRRVTFEKTTYNELPLKFEAGTPHIAGGIGMGAAIDYVNHIGLDKIAAYEHELLAYGTEALSRIPGLRIIGTAREKAAVLSFVIEGIHPHDLGTVLDLQGIAVRTGHHCAQPVMDRFQVPATTRASLAFYNTFREIDALAAGLSKVKQLVQLWQTGGKPPQAAQVTQEPPAPLTTTLTIVSGFDRDMRSDSWKLLEDTGDPAEFDVSRLELVSFLETGETYTRGETMLKRARGEMPVNGKKLVGCNWGQRHGEALLRNQHLIPAEWRGKVIVLPGTVWRDIGRRVPCLFFDGEQWVLYFRWLVSRLISYCRLLRPRELP